MLLRLLVAAGVAVGAVSLAAGASMPQPGVALYREGRLPDGTPLHGRWESGADVTGAAAACVNCHRRSALGSVEGNTVVPPILGEYLFRPRAANVQDLSLPHVPGFTPNAWSYDESTLARAIRDGVRPDGSTLGALMPRYALDDGAMAALVAYLRSLDRAPVPGVSDTTLDFATIVTPDADPVEKAAMLQVLERFFETQRHVIAAETRPMHAAREIQYRVTRQWRLHVWTLRGEPSTWGAQLEGLMAAEPVFAVISGIGRGEWRPIHRFCEQQEIPCLFPNVDLPVVAEGDFYPVYFSRGVLLEADLVASALAAMKPRPARLVEVYRDADIGAPAALALATKARALGIPVTLRPLHPAPTAEAGRADLATAEGDLAPDDALMSWLRPVDLAALRGAPRAGHVYASGLMGGLDQAPLPATWREETLLTYPADPPALRRARMNFPLAWFKVQGIPVTAERVQTDTYLACVILAETLGHVLDSFVRDFLVERLEMMLSRRLANGYFPHLGLAPGQRFASKGGYLARLPADGGDATPASDWLTP